MKKFEDIQHEALDFAAHGPRLEEFRAAFGDQLMEGMESKGYLHFAKHNRSGIDEIIVVITLAGTRLLLDYEGLKYD